MIPRGLFMQIVMIAVAFGIAFWYVSPTFAVIGELQDSIAIYREEKTKIDAVNEHLADLVEQANNLADADLQRLETYLPYAVDSVSVQRDLLFIVERAGLNLLGLSFKGIPPVLAAPLAGEEQRSRLVPYSFVVAVEGTYEQFKQFLSLLERNNYPLEVSELKLGGVDLESPNMVKAELRLLTYAFVVAEAYVE
jgi:exonuclease VII small subunit